MLSNLNIRDFALIERLTLDLEPGLNVFTGETGAGKSLVVQAFSLLLGERASSDLVRAGADRAGVQAVFRTGEAPWIASVLDRAGVPADDGDGGLLVSRDIGRKARGNRCFVNGRLAPLSLLKELGRGLVDLHGQHDHQRLLRPSEHLEVLDEFGGPGLMELREAAERAIGALRDFEAEQAALRERERERLIERDNILFQVNEIDSVSPEAGEYERVSARQRLAANAERLRSLYASVEALLSGEDGIVDGLRRGWSMLDEICGIDPAADGLRKDYHEAVYLLEELASELSRRAESVEADPAELAELEERLGALNRLLRKYGPGMDDVLEFRKSLDRRLEAIEGAERALADGDRRRGKLLAELGELLPRLGRARAEAASRLEDAVTAELAELGMSSARFMVAVDREESGGDEASSSIELDGRRYRMFARGLERVEFRIAPNDGEPAGPLSKIASGGEISRVMLAMKAALASRDRVPIMVFDEIDAGIGGETAWNVAAKLRQVSRTCQCICITHLPQIAACADGHFVVSKRETEGRTLISVRSVSGEDRVGEIARMLGGSGEAAVRHARELLERSASLAFRSAVASGGSADSADSAGSAGSDGSVGSAGGGADAPAGRLSGGRGRSGVRKRRRKGEAR